MNRLLDVWVYLKNKVFRTPSNSLENLREYKVTECEILRQQQMVRTVVRKMQTRAQTAVENEGGYVEKNKCSI